MQGVERRFKQSIILNISISCTYAFLTHVNVPSQIKTVVKWISGDGYQRRMIRNKKF